MTENRRLKQCVREVSQELKIVYAQAYRLVRKVQEDRGDMEDLSTEEMIKAVAFEIAREARNRG